MWVWSRLATDKWRDAWEERFLGLGQTNAVITAIPGRRTIRIEVYCPREREAMVLQRDWGGSVRRLAREAPMAAPAPPRVLRIRRRLVVVNAEETPGDLTDSPLPVLRIPAAMAFGTGDHATTATCLRLLADLADGHRAAGRQDWSMADLGTGTGILAFAARLFGASETLAMDNDPVAIRVARRNARLNRIRGITFQTADLRTWSPPRRFDVVAANVFADILGEAMPVLRRTLARGGCLILSGILRAQADEVVRAARKYGLDFPVARTAGKWTTLMGGHAGRG